MKYNRLAAYVSLLALTGCAQLPFGDSQRVSSSAGGNGAYVRQGGQERSRTVMKTQPGQVDPKIQPYSVMGKTYWPIQSGLGYREEGVASWYGIDFHGKKTATGEVYDMFGVSAAHKTLPLGTKVRVTNLENGREVELVVNDRGPFVDGRIIDLSYASARALGMAENGVARVRVEGLADNPVLAQNGYKAVAVASGNTPPRARPAFVEKTITEEISSLRKGQAGVSAAPAAPAVAEVRVVRREAADVSGMAVRDGGARFVVQVGAFSQDENARRVRDRLVQAGFRGASITKTVRGGRELSVVQAGVFPAREQAEEALRAVQNEFPASFISSGA